MSLDTPRWRLIFCAARNYRDIAVEQQNEYNVPKGYGVFDPAGLSRHGIATWLTTPLPVRKRAL
jgi:hypothetical protein